MKKALVFLVMIMFILLTAKAGEWINISNQKVSPAEISLISSDNNSNRIHFSIPGFEFLEVNTSQGNAFTLGLEEATSLLEAGSPDLLKLTASIIIPDLAGMDVRVISSEFTDYENILIAPSKGNLTRDIDPSALPYVFGDVYAQDDFYPGTLVSLRDPYIVRDFRGQTAVVYPFQYNPVSKVLRVYHSIEIEIFKVNDNGINPLVRDRMPESIAIEYAMIYERQFLNSPGNVMDYTPVSEHGNMLIISYGSFIPAMKPLIDWRKQTGTPVEIVDVSTIGGSSQIKSYIANYYNSNGLTFCLLVGDAAQVPSSFSSGDSDNDYSYVVGNDHYPDLFIGRFSAETVNHVDIMVERTIAYEKTPDLGFDWFTRGIGIASDQGPGDDNEYDYEHIRNINTDLLNFTYTYCAELFDGSQGGNDAPGNPTPTMVADEIETGSTIINYTGHGSTTAWSSSGFNNSNINSLTNTTMWPFIWSVACVNGNFVGNTCFAEAWLRAEDNGTPTGAVATLMSTINQSWNPPMCGQDEMVDILVETYPSNINRTFGAASMHGCMQMNDEYGSAGDEMTDTWTCFGDPGLHMRTAFPQTMVTSYLSTLFIGMSQLEITADAEGGTACLTKDGEILSSGFISGGIVNLTFPELTEPCILTLTITGFNYLPHINQIDVIPGNAPFLMFEEDHVVDPLGNNNGFMDFGESITYTVDLYNLGAVDATDVEVILSTSDPYITITDNYELYPSIPAGQVVGIPEGFALEIANNVPDEHEIDFTVTASNQDTTWIIEYKAEAYAPILNIAEMIIDDNTSGNGNGRMDPGETVTLKIKNFNSGHCPAENTTASLSSLCQYLTFANNTYNVGTLGLLGSTWSQFEVTIDPDAPDGAAIAEFEYQLTSGAFTETATFKRKIGLIVEDWETGDFTKFEWELGGDQPFEISTLYPYEGTYSARSGNISDGQKSELEIDVEVMLDDSVTFAYKTSSQTNKDKLKFYINNNLMGEWSGMISIWQKVAFPVETGNYTFKWVYEKDASGMSGYDGAWIDFITFPPLMTLTCYAGPDDYNCGDGSYQCRGEATDWVAVEWTTDGDGTFDDPHILEPVYLPGVNDLSTGIVILTLSAEDADGSMVDDEMYLSLIDVPETPVMPAGPDYVNVYNTVSSEYSTEAVPYTDNYSWLVDPAEAGTFSGIGTSGTITWNQDYEGIAMIYVKAINSCGQSEYSEGFEVTVDNIVSVEETAIQGSFMLFPNPGNGDLTIITRGINAGKYNIITYNMLGRMMTKESGVYLHDGTNLNINLSTLTEGMYFLVIEGKGERMVRKLIINR